MDKAELEAELATIETETRAADGERRAVLGEAEAGRRELGRVRAALDTITGGNTDNTRCVVVAIVCLSIS